MTKKDRIKNILNRQKADKCGFWLGDPMPDVLEALYNEYNVSTRLELAQIFDEDIVHLPCEFAWESPDGRQLFSVLFDKKRVTLGDAGIFGECEDPADVDKIQWDDPHLFNLSKIDNMLCQAEKMDLAIFSGMWTTFFHIVSDFFGMENYFVKMYTNPEVVLAVTKKVEDFYIEGNKFIFENFAHRMDAFFLGNDFGTQISMLIGKDNFRKFVLPTYKKLFDLAHSYGLNVVVHSCGSIAPVIPDLIEAGADCLHPLQARAKDMDANSISEKFNGKIAFMGGIDTQQLLPFGTDEEIKNEVLRVKSLLGPNYIISPSHETLQKDVPMRAIKALINVAKER